MPSYCTLMICCALYFAVAKGFAKLETFEAEVHYQTVVLEDDKPK